MINEEKLAAWEKALPERDRADWHRYQMALSIPEMRMKADAMLNVRLTLRYLSDGPGQEVENNLTESEKSSYLRMLVNQLSQIEHWSFETWRETRRSRMTLTISMVFAVIVNIFFLMFFVFTISTPF